MGTMERVMSDRALLGGLGVAFAAFALTFRGPRKQFWNRMTLTGLTLGSLALAQQPELRRTRLKPADVATGLGSMAVLYGIFQVGDRLARRILPKGASEIDSIYDLKGEHSRALLGARLALIIGPAEELFWRGFVQRRLAEKFGNVPGYVLATTAYGGAHLVTGNFTLIGAASVAGAFWGGMAAAGLPMSALIISHSAWDAVIFLIAPTVVPGPKKG
jgi:membrane protease YdiL (CAAX protease family)